MSKTLHSALPPRNAHSKFLFRTLFRLIRRFYFLPCLAIFLFVFSEFLIYYLVIFSCSWPVTECSPQAIHQNDKYLSGTLSDNSNTPLQAIILSDPYLLSKYAHWLDKLRRWALQQRLNYFAAQVQFLQVQPGIPSISVLPFAFLLNYSSLLYTIDFPSFWCFLFIAENGRCVAHFKPLFSCSNRKLSSF